MIHKPTVERLLKIAAVPISCNPVWFVSIYLLLLFCNFLFAWNGSRMIGALQLFLDLYMVALLLALLPGNASRLLRALLAVVLYAVCAVDLFCYSRLGCPITPSLLSVALQSNNAEAYEAVATYTADFKQWILVSGVLAIAVIHLLLSMIKRVNMAVVSVAERLKTKIGASALVLLIISLPVCCKNEIYLFHRLVLCHDEKQTYIDTGISPSVRFYTPVHRLANAVIEYCQQKGVITHLHNSIERAVVDSCSYTSPYIVLIIGESYCKHHSQLYGYGLETTPHQKRHAEEGNLILFDDAVAQWNLTSESFRCLLSTHCDGDSAYWYNYPLFTTLFKKAGYETVFLSNQFVTKASETYSDFDENILLNDPRMSSAQFTHRNSNRHQYDEGLLNDYEALALPDNPKGQLVIFHLMGQHVDFGQRYPQSCAHFDASMYNVAFPDVTAQYDNATRYNDFILNSIIELFEEKDAVIIHIADHGERTGVNEGGYGRSFSFTVEDIRQQYEIPFWIYTTQLYKENHKAVVQQMERAKELPVLTDNIAHMLLYLGGVHTRYYQKSNNPLDDAFNAGRARIIGGSVDYDKAVSDTEP